MNDLLLIEGLRRRDKVVFDYIFNYYYSSLCAFSMRYINDRNEVEDLVQDFFVSLWIEAPNLQIRSSLKSYLFAGVKNRCLDFQKHQKVSEKYRAYILFSAENGDNTTDHYFAESELRQGKYLPQAILGVEIPKSNGKTRLLGIPTVVDRLLQQAVGQVIAIKFEMEFEDYSYGFRPNRNAQQAVLKSQEYINSGYQHIVDIDLKSFFDEVDHCILLQLLYRKVKCPLTLRLIRKWLRAPIQINGRLSNAGKVYRREVR